MIQVPSLELHSKVQHKCLEDITGTETSQTRNQLSQSSASCQTIDNIMSSTCEGGKFQFAIDRGGTFTDVFARCPDGQVRVMKLLSVDPKNYRDAPTEGIRRILEAETGQAHPRNERIDASRIEWIRMGTTVATNALLERKGERMGLVVTKGFKDILFIGNQARPKLFDLAIVKPDMLYEEVIEVSGRILPKRDDCQMQNSWPVLKGSTGEEIFETEPLNEPELKQALQKLLDKNIKCIAVALMHSFLCADHEQRIQKIAQNMGFTHISLSSSVMPMVRIVPRGHTAAVDAYLTPAIERYLQGFASGFTDDLKNVNVLFMQSDGGLTPMNCFNGSRAILSGPAGGVVGYASTTFGKETNQAVIGFDMGGTSTDVSRFDGSYEHVFETTTAGVTIQAPQLDISTVAAGGGSVLSFRAGLFLAGPESASAHPGPACYRKGGPLTITDANLVLGRLLPSYFPKIFGPNENESLDKETSVAAFQEITKEINEFMKTQMSVEEVAMGFVKVANETMCRPIRNLTQGKGYDTRDHVLACFGGAGGQHACSIARSLGMKTVYIHKYAGILSAYGMALADVVHEEQEPSALEYNEANLPRLLESLDNLADKCTEALLKQGFSKEQIHHEKFLHMRYQGTDCALMCSASKDEDYLSAFLKRYKTEFGFTLQNRAILVDDVRVRGVGCTDFGKEDDIENCPERAPEPVEVVRVFFDDKFEETKVYKMEQLRFGHVLKGPCIVMDKLSTILVECECQCVVSAQGNLRIDVGGHEKIEKIGTQLDTVQLSVFSHRFMSIAEQMGRILQRTSISTNIKERLDFSCALFGPDGGLVSNAPHIPVHLGAMQSTVRYQMDQLGEDLHEGDVILANHPQAGGSHLPDLTVITPVFYSGIKKPVFFVANRGHHADIGGISPGSMPPHSKYLWEEGARFKSFKIVERGQLQEDALIAELNAPAKYPGCSGTRLLADNLSDLKAQIAANQRGIQLVTELIDAYGLDVVQAYMNHIQENAEVSVRQVLKKFGKSKQDASTGKCVVYAEDFMDDGSKIGLTVSIDPDEGSAVFDFSSTGPEVWGNINAPKAVTHSALIYSLRCLVGEEIPLNQGCLNPVEIIIPRNSLLDPSENAAVVGGNVLTSQRVVDVILKAFEACAASQGCCNNITFGDERFGYYETVAGGSGGGPSWHGRSGVHVHMTNTRLTDPEILERRYPVWLREFHLNPGSGGEGKFNGGDGVLRAIQFLKPLTLSVLTDRRVHSPYGMNNGKNGKCGQNLLKRAEDGIVINLGGKCSVPVASGDIFILQTPGGGGWGMK